MAVPWSVWDIFLPGPSCLGVHWTSRVVVGWVVHWTPRQDGPDIYCYFIGALCDLVCDVSSALEKEAFGILMTQDMRCSTQSLEVELLSPSKKTYPRIQSCRRPVTRTFRVLQQDVI